MILMGTREITILTDSKGADLFHKAMTDYVNEQCRHEARKLINKARNSDIITWKETKRLREMVDSPDIENTVVVETILEVKLKEHGRTI